MKIQHYCYTRAEFVDYCVFVRPNNLSQSAIKEIQSKVLSITDSIGSKLSIPKWILIKTPEYILWGVCCLNRVLSDEYNCDYSGTPVSGMFGIVITEYSDDIQLPFDIEYFHMLYGLEVSKFWTRQEAHLCQTDGFISGKFHYVQAKNNHYTDLLNTDSFKCLSLGNINRDEVISAVLTLDNVSLLIDNDNIEQATNMKGAFMNCLSSSVPPGSYSVKQLCPRCKEYVSFFTPTGICKTCQAKEQIKIDKIKMEEYINKQLKIDLDEANSTIKQLKYDIEEANNLIRKKVVLIKILSGVIGLLLLSMIYIRRNTLSLNLLGSGKKHSIQHEVLNGIPSGTVMPNVNHLFVNPEIVVGLSGNESLMVEYDNSYCDVDFIPNVDWVKIISKTPNLMIQVLPYDSDSRREAIITAKYGQYCDSLTITQKK